MSLPNWSLAPEPKNFRSHEWRVPLTELSHTEAEIQRVLDVLHSGWWTCGPETDALEREFEKRLGVQHAIAVSSGTAALHLAFLALKLRQGQEVVTPAFNFVASANTILHAGASPRFADVDAIEAPLVSAESLERAITPNTRGICVMHYGGYPCEMDSIMDLARKHGLWVVEDAAHAPGASWKGIPCGKWGDISCFSFFGNKNLTCAEGGLVTTEDESLANKLRLLRSHGMDSLTWDRFRGHSVSYDVTAPGFNFRMDDIRAAILRMQLKSLDRWNRLRQERVCWYHELLETDARWTIPFKNHVGVSACHLFVLVLEEKISRTKVMHFLKNRGIQTSIHYPPTHQFSYYRNLGLDQPDLGLTEDLGRRIITLPLFPGMTYEQISMVCAALREAVESGDADAE